MLAATFLKQKLPLKPFLNIRGRRLVVYLRLDGDDVLQHVPILLLLAEMMGK